MFFSTSFQPKLNITYEQNIGQITLYDPVINCCLPDAVLINTSLLTYRQNPAAIGTRRYIIGNTNKPHSLSHILVCWSEVSISKGYI
jgi:hypothetical protein